MELEKSSLKESLRAQYAEETKKGECTKCKKEREERILVASGPEDKRFMEPKFLAAPAVVPNNDMKYELNKKRALGYASKKKTGVLYCRAKDKLLHEAIRTTPDLLAQIISWLTRHDRESGDLYGILPLMRGMPVALTEHIDRSEDKRLLRRRVGWVHS